MLIFGSRTSRSFATKCTRVIDQAPEELRIAELGRWRYLMYPEQPPQAKALGLSLLEDNRMLRRTFLTPLVATAALALTACGQNGPQLFRS